MMGFEMIPNWHPLFVHFTIAFLSVASVLYIISAFGDARGGWRREAFTVSRWCFAIGAVSLLLTVAAGFHAYNTVAHDGPSHIAMIKHRDAALLTSALLVVLIGASFALKKLTAPSKILSIGALALLAVLSVTAYWGGELVFRHGLGVMSMPEAGGDHHKKPEPEVEQRQDKSHDHSHDHSSDHGNHVH